MAEPADINVDELRRRARRRLVGAVVLALAVAVIVPMLLETEQKPLGDDVSVKIPPIDESKFVNRLNDTRAKDAPKGAPRAAEEPPKGPVSSVPPSATPEQASKYDTRVPEAGASSGSASPSPMAADAVSSTKPDGAKPDGAKQAAPDAKPASASAPVSAPTPVPSSPPPAADTAKAPPAPDDASKHASAAPSRPTPAGNGNAAAPHDGFAVQLAAFADDRGANALAARLKKAGYTAYTEPLNTSKGTLWRVRVGPYPSREAALAARDKLKTEGQSGIVAAIK